MPCALLSVPICPRVGTSTLVSLPPCLHLSSYPPSSLLGLLSLPLILTFPPSSSLPHLPSLTFPPSLMIAGKQVSLSLSHSFLTLLFFSLFFPPSLPPQPSLPCALPPLPPSHTACSHTTLPPTSLSHFSPSYPPSLPHSPHSYFTFHCIYGNSIRLLSLFIHLCQPLRTVYVSSPAISTVLADTQSMMFRYRRTQSSRLQVLL